MKEYKIQIFEDDWATIKGAFELANIFAFDNKLKFIVRAKSQDASFTSWREKFDAVFIDITLAKNTKLDGYNILKEIKEKDLFDLNRVAILTGNSKVIENLSEIGIEANSIKIIYKPIDFESLSKEIKILLGL